MSRGNEAWPSLITPLPGSEPIYNEPFIRRGEFHINALSNRRLQRVLTSKNGGQLGRLLKQLRLHGRRKKIGHTYKYDVAALGQKLLVAALKLKEHLIRPCS